MQNALDDAGIRPEQVEHINAHGTSTQLNDACETRALRRVFGAHASKLQISATKSMTGHLLGAAGGLESVFTVLALHEGALPGTINLAVADPECDLDYLSGGTVRRFCEYALCNSFGFGGTNACILFKAYRD
jgi:3-oxoacyl-[acyl-carrier-protein] synthase II